jgi:hypothetical protein
MCETLNKVAFNIEIGIPGIGTIFVQMNEIMKKK